MAALAGAGKLLPESGLAAGSINAASVRWMGDNGSHEREP
jgi:hypothetical protein